MICLHRRSSRGQNIASFCRGKARFKTTFKLRGVSPQDHSNRKSGLLGVASLPVSLCGDLSDLRLHSRGLAPLASASVSAGGRICVGVSGGMHVTAVEEMC